MTRIDVLRGQDVALWRIGILSMRRELPTTRPALPEDGGGVGAESREHGSALT